MDKFTATEVEASIDHAAELVGVSALKPLQREAIRTFVQEKDVFVSLPTGFGKSLCFALLPQVFERLRGSKGTSIVLCISPLTVLMLEQRTKFTLRGIRSEFIGQLQQDVFDLIAVQRGQVQLLYVSPESILCNPQWREMLLLEVYQKNLVVDEAHCITMW